MCDLCSNVTTVPKCDSFCIFDLFLASPCTYVKTDIFLVPFLCLTCYSFSHFYINPNLVIISIAGYCFIDLYVCSFFLLWLQKYLLYLLLPRTFFSLHLLYPSFSCLLKNNSLFSFSMNLTIFSVLKGCFNTLFLFIVFL